MLLLLNVNILVLEPIRSDELLYLSVVVHVIHNTCLISCDKGVYRARFTYIGGLLINKNTTIIENTNII
jgi:hypothetical protein